MRRKDYGPNIQNWVRFLRQGCVLNSRVESEFVEMSRSNVRDLKIDYLFSDIRDVRYRHGLSFLLLCRCSCDYCRHCSSLKNPKPIGSSSNVVFSVQCNRLLLFDQNGYQFRRGRLKSAFAFPTYLSHLVWTHSHIDGVLSLFTSFVLFL